jgi:hypothetical protein
MRCLRRAIYSPSNPIESGEAAASQPRPLERERKGRKVPTYFHVEIISQLAHQSER